MLRPGDAPEGSDGKKQEWKLSKQQLNGLTKMPDSSWQLTMRVIDNYQEIPKCLQSLPNLCTQGYLKLLKSD